MADSVRESGAAAPGKYRHCFVQDWPPARTGCVPTPLQRDLCGCAASPTPVFSAPAHGTRPRALHSERARSSLQEAFPLYITLAKRCGEDRQEEMRQRRATSSAAEDGLLQLFELVEEANGIENLGHLGQFLLHLGREYP